MPINIEFKTDIEGLRSLARWYGNGSESVYGAGSAVRGVKGDAEGDWGGQSGHAFNCAMSKFGTGVDGVSNDMTEAQRAVDAFADDMDTVKSRLKQACDVAAGAGLGVSETEIKDPGPAPASPGDLDDNPTPEAIAAHAEAQAACEEHENKVKAYKECETIASGAEAKRSAAMTHLSKFAGDQLQKAPFTVADVSAGLAGEAVKRATKFDELARSYSRRADQLMRLALSSDIDDPAVRAALRENAEAVAARYAALQKIKGPISQAALKLPTGVQTILTKDVGEYITDGSKLARAGKVVFGKIPVVGAGVTAVSAVGEIASGKDPTKAIVGGAASLAAGAAAGAAVGSFVPVPGVGTVVGTIVGAGVGYVVDEWGDEIAGAAGDAAEAVGDAGEAVGGAISDGAGAVGEFVGDLF